MATFNEFQLQGDNLTSRETKKIWREIADTYDTARKEINKELTAVYAKFLTGVKPENYRTELIKINRLDALLKNTTDEYVKAANKAGRLQVNASRVSIVNNLYRQEYALNFGMGIDIFTAIPNDVVKIAVAGTEKAWEAITPKRKTALEKVWGSLTNYQPKYGTLQDVLVENRSRDVAKMKQIINQGLIQGKGLKSVASDINKTFGITINNAERIYRTETHRNRALGDWANWNQAQAEGLNVWREIVSTLDNRTRQQSAYVDGKIDKDGSGFLYPDENKYLTPGSTGVAKYDINDRERVIQIIPGLEGDEKRRGRDPVTGENEVFSYRNFDTWAKENDLKRNIYGELLTI